MRAAYVKAPYQFEIREFDMREITEDEVLVKVKACGICGTDLSTAATEAADWQPFGHEIAGIVEKKGKHVNNVRIGKKVVLESGTFCRTCSNCRNGRVDLCNKGPNYWLTGPMGFADYIIVPKETLVPFEGISFKEASFASPSLYFPTCIELIQSGVIEAKALISHTFKLDEIEEAMKILRDDRETTVKSVMVNE